MSGRNPKKNQKLASSRRYKNRNRDTEEKENDGFPDPENEDHGSEQSHSVPESQASNESSVLHSDQPVVAYTNPNTSDIEQSLHPQSQDPLAQPEVTSKKRKMGSTRKPRNLKFEGIHEDEPEHMIQKSEGVRDEQGWTPESSIKEDGGKDDQKCILDCAGNNESSILQEQHLAIMLSEEHQNSEKGIQNKPMDNSFSELNQSLKTEFGQELLHTSLDVSIVPPAECNVPLQESDESLQICHQMDTFSEPVVSLPNTTDQTSMINISYTPPNENREESLDVQTSMTEHTVLKTIEDQSSLDFIIIEKQEDKQEREDVDIPNNCSAEDIGQNEVPELQSASVIKEHEHGTQVDKASKEDENVVDLEHMDDTLKLITESIGKFKSTELREDMDENKEVSVAADRTDINSGEWVVVTNLNQVMEPDRSLTLPIKLKDQEEGLEQLHSSEFRFQPDSKMKSYKEKQYDLSEVRCWIGENSADDIAKGHYDKEALGTEKGVENDDRQHTDSNQLLFSKVSSTNMLHCVLESGETQYGETETSSQTCNLPHNNPGEFPSELELQSKKVCSDEMLENVIKDRSEFLALETEVVVEDNNDDIKEENNSGSTLTFTKEGFIKVDDEKDGVSTFMIEHELKSVITNTQDYASADKASMVLEEFGIKSPDKESTNPVHIHPASSPMELNPKTQFELDMQVYNPIAVHNQTQNVSEECIVNPTNRESEAEQFKSTFPIVHETRLGQDDAVAENVSFCHSEKNIIDLTHRNLGLLIPEGDQKETMQVQSIEEMTCVSENVTFSFTPETSHNPRSSVSLNIKEPDQINKNAMEKDENVTNAVVENENTNSSQEHYEAPKHISTGLVSTNQECGVRDRQDEETVMVKNICGGVYTTHIMLSDDNEHLVDREDFKMLSRTEMAKSIEQNQEAICDGDKDGQCMSIEEPHQHTHIDLKFEESKSSEFTEHVNFTTSAQDTGEAAQLPDTNNIQTTTTTPILKEDHVLISTKSGRKKMGSTRKGAKRELKDEEKVSNAIGLSDIIEKQQKPIVNKEKDAESMLLNEQEITSVITPIHDNAFKDNERLVVKKHCEKSPDKHASSTCGAVELISETQVVTDMEIHTENVHEVEFDQNQNFTKEDTIAVCSQQYTLCGLSSQTTDLSLSTIKNPSPAPEHHEVIKDNGNSVDNVDSRNAEIHTQTQIKKKKNFGSTRRPHGGHEPHAEEEKRELKDAEDTEEIEHQIITQDTTSHMISESQNPVSKVSLDISDSLVTTEQKEIIPSEIEIMTERSDAPPAFLDESKQIHTELSDEVSNAGELPNVTEQDAKTVVDEEKDTASIVLNDQEMVPVTSPIKNDAFMENVFLAVNKNNEESPDHEHASSTCEPVELIPNMQAMSDMQLTTEDIDAVVSNQNQNKCEEQLENPASRESEPVCSQQYKLCELSSQTTDLSLFTIEHPSPAPEHHGVMEDNGNSVDNVEIRNAEIHTQTQIKKKKKFGSTRRPHGGHEPHAEEEKGKWKDAEVTEEFKPQIITQDTTSHMITESQNVSEMSLDINNSPVTTEQKEIIQPEIEIMTERIDAPPAFLDESKQIHTELSDEVSNAGELPDVTEQDAKTVVDEEKDTASIVLNDQEMVPVTSPIKNDAFMENVFLAITKNNEESPDHEHASSTCEPVELIPNMQAMSDMQLTTEDIDTFLSKQNQNKCEEQLENPTSKKSEPDQNVITNPLVKLQESKSPEVDVIEEHLEFSSSEKKRKIEEIIAGQMENFTTEDITTVCSQQFTLCELSSQTTDLSLFTIEHTSPAPEHHGVMEDNGNSVDNVDTRNAEIHTQTQIKKKKKFGSTRRPHGGHKPHAEEEKGEWKDAEVTEEFNPQIITQDATSHMITESQNVSEMSLDMNDSLVTNEQKEAIQSEIEIMTERIDAPPAFLDKSKQIHTELSDEVSNAGELPDVTEQDGKTVVDEEKDTVSIVLNDQEMVPVTSPIKNDAFMENVFLAVNKNNEESPDHEHASSTCEPVELIPEMQAMSDMQLTTEDIDAVVSNQNQNKCEEQLENPASRESEPVCSQQYKLCELSSQTTDLSLFTIEHPSPAPEHHGVMEDNGNSVDNVEIRNAEIHTQTLSKKKKKFGSTRRPHGGHEPHAEEEKGKWKDAEVTEEFKPQIITQDTTSHMITESQNVSEMSLDINNSPVTTEQKEIIQSEIEIMTERIDAPPAFLDESKQIHTELSDEVSNAGELPDVTEQDAKTVVNEEKDTASIVLNDQEMAPVISPIKNDAFMENVFLAVTKNNEESPDHEHASFTCEPVELIPEMQAMSDMQLTTEDIDAVVSDQNQNKCEEQLENPASKESEPVCSQQYTLCELSSQTTDLSLFTIEHPSPAPEHHGVMEDIGNSVDNVDTRNAEIHTQTQIKKKKKFGSTRRPHGGHKPHAEEEKGEWKDAEVTEEFKPQIITQDATSHMITESQNVSEMSLDINDSPVTTEQKEAIQSEIEIMTERIDAPPAFLDESKQIHTELSDEVSNAGELPDVTEQDGKTVVDEEKDTASIVLIDQEMVPVISPIKNDAFMENVFLAVHTKNEESPDHEHASSTCEPVDLIPNMQAMSDMQLTTEDIDVVVSDQNQNKCEEQLENPASKESEPDQNVTTNPLVKIQESKSPEVDVIEEHLEFSSSEKKRKIGSTRKRVRFQNPGSDQKNKSEAINEQENTQEQNTDQNDRSTGVIEEESNDSKEEIHVSHTENLTNEDIIAVCSQQYTLCELSSQSTDLSLSTNEHPSPAPQHPEVIRDDEKNVENVENRNPEIHTQTLSKKKKKFGSTRRPHGGHELHAEGEKNELKDAEVTEELKPQIITQDATLHMITESQNVSEMSLNINNSLVTTEQKEIIQSEIEIMTERIDAPPAFLDESKQIHTELSDEVSNAGELPDVTEQDAKTVVDEEKDAASIVLNDQEMVPVTSPIKNDAFMENVFLAVHKNNEESPDHEHASSTCEPVELIPEMQAMSDMQLTTEDIDAILSDQNQNKCEEQLKNPASRESEPVCSQQYTLCELSSQTTDLSLFTIEHPSPAPEHHGVMEDNGNSVDNVDTRNAEIHTQTQIKKKKKFGSTRRPHGGHKPHAEEEKGEWKDAEVTEELKPQIITQDATSHMITESQNVSRMSLDINNSLVTTEQKEIIQSEIKIMTERIDAPPAFLNESKQIHTELSDEVSNAGELPDVTEQDAKTVVDEEKDTASIVLNDQEMVPVTSPIKNDAFMENVFLAVNKNNEESPDHEHASSTCEPVELIPEMQAMSDMQLTTEDIDAVVSNQNQNKCEEQLENPASRESEPVCSQQYTLCELSSQTTDLSLFTIEHPSPAPEHHGVMEDNGNSVDNVDTRIAEIHTQTQIKKKKKFGSTRRPHGGHEPHTEEEKGEWKDAEVTEEFKPQIITQDTTSHMITESQNVSEMSLDINDSLVTTEQKEIIQSEIENMTERIDAPPAFLDESKQIHIELSDEVSNAGELPDVTEQDGKTVVDEEKDTASIVLNDQEMVPVTSPIKNDAFMENVFLAVNKNNEESPDHEHASSTCEPVELIPNMQAMSDMQLTTEDIDVVVSDQNQNKCEEQLENPASKESEPDQNVITNPLVKIQESKSPEVDVIEEHLEFSSSEKKRKIGSTRKRVRFQNPGSDQKNKSEAINEQENTQEQNTDQNDKSTGVIEEESNDSKEEIHVSHTENLTNEDIIAVCSQQYTLCELSSQSTDLSLSTNEHPSPAPQHPEVIRDDEKNVENVENRNPEIHTQTLSKKKKKFGSTRRPHGGHELHAEGEKNELKDAEVTEELKPQIITQDATLHMITESQNVSEMSLNINDSLVTTEQKEIIQSEIEIMTERIDAPPAFLDESKQIHTELSDEVSNAGELPDVTEQDAKTVVDEEKDAASIVLNDQEMVPVTSPIKNDAFMENVFLAVHKNNEESPDHEHASSTCEPVELIPEMQAMSDMQLTTEDIDAILSDQNQNKCEEQLKNPASRESEPVCSQQYTLCELSSQTTDLSLFTIEHPSPAPEHHGVMEDNGNSVDNVDTRNAEIHTQTQIKKKKKFGSTRRPHGGHKPHAKEEKGEWKDAEVTEELKPQIITQDATSHMITESQNVSEMSLDINDSLVTTEQKEIIQSEIEIMTERIDAPPAFLDESKQIHTELSDEVSNAGELPDVTEQDEKTVVNEEKDTASIVLNDQEMAPVTSPMKNDAFMENVFLAVNKNNEESPDHEHASSTCEPVELIPNMQAMSDMQLTTEDIDAVVSDQNQNKCEEQLENPASKESEPDQNVITNPLVKIQESKSPEVDVIEEHLEFSSSEKKRKIGSTRKRVGFQNSGSDQKNKSEAINKQENTQEQNTDQNDKSTGFIKEESNDSKEEIHVSHTENLTNEDIIAVCSQQYTLCELSSQSTDLSLSTNEHPSPAPQHPEVIRDDEKNVENVENRNPEIHTQTLSKKKKKFGSTRRPHGGHELHAEGEKNELKDAEVTEELKPQIITQDATLHMLTESQNPVSEVSLDISDSLVTTEQQEIIKSVNKIMKERIDAPPALLDESEQILTELSDGVSNAGELTNIIEHEEKPVVNKEKETESIVLNEPGLEPVISPMQDNTFIKNMFLAVKKHGDESPDHEHASSTCEPVELIPNMQAMSDMQLTTEDIDAVVSDQNQNKNEEQLENPTSRESEPDQHVITNPFVHIQDSNSPQVNVIKENLEFSSSKKKRKIGSTRRSLRGQIHGSDQKINSEAINEQENTQEQTTDQNDSNTGVIKEESNDSKKEIHVSHTENITKEDITTIFSQQYTLCELSSQTTDLSLSTNEHPSPAPQHPEDIEDNENNVENLENRNSEIYTQSQSKKKKKFGSTRRLHGGHELHVEKEIGKWNDPEITEEINIMDQAASSNLFSDPNNAMSEFLLNTLQPSLKAEQGVESNESESTMQRSYPSIESVECIPETQARLDMPVLAEQYQTMSAEHQESSKNKETEPEQYEDSCAAHIEELKYDNMAIQTNTAQTKDSYSGRKKKMGSTRKSLRVMRDEERIQEPTTEKTTPNSELNNAKKETLNLNTEIAHSSIQTLSQPIYVIEPEREKTGLTYKNREEGREKNENRDPRNVGDIDRESLKSKATEDMVNSDFNLCGTEGRIQDYELPIHLKPDPSEGSLLSEIELYLNKNTLNTATTTTTNRNIPELSEPMSERSLQLSSQNPQIHLKPNSPARRKMGSSRKMSKNKHTEKISDEGGASEQENLNFEKKNVKNSEPKTEAKTDMDTVMAKSTKESVEVMSKASGQPLPEVRRKFGSRRTTNGRSGLGAFTRDDYESNQKNTDVQATKDGIMVSDPELIKEPESTAISQPVSEKRPGIDEVTTTTVDDTNVSTEAGLVSLDDMEKSLLFVVSTGGKPKIDFEQWNEQLPEFEEVVYNIVMVGNSSVGKTSFIKRLQNGQFIPDYSATIGVDTFVQTIQFGNRTVKLYVWDTAGQERYHSITKQVFNKAQGLLLMYDITSSQSFHAIRSWISQVQEKAPPETILMLLGNKNDCAHREVQLQEGENLAKEYDIHFMECSAATGENVLDSMKTLAWLLVKQRVRKVDEYTTLQQKPQNKKSGCC